MSKKNRLKAMFSLFLMATASPLASARTFTVTRENNNLHDIAVRLYGDGGHWKLIAKWNHLRNPSRLRVGQVLKLKEAPTLTSKQGNHAVLEMWRSRLDGPERSLASSYSSDPTTRTRFEATLKESPAPAPNDPAAIFDRGESDFKDKKYDLALESFRKSRALNPALLPAWFYEIRTLKLLGKKNEATQVAQALKALRPEFKDMPALKTSEAGP
jgi:tetratricopeptide (TPR) repeat protein